MEEIWKDVIGYEGKYQVSNQGRVKSLIKEKERLLKPRTFSGYNQNILYNGKPMTLYVHRLVAQSFIPNPENKAEINHKNGKKTDNRVENLEWCTRSENIKHSYHNKLQIPINGQDHYKSKITEEQAKKIKYNHKGMSQLKVASIYGITQGHVSDIRLGKRWKHV